jgi:hypothetical protein
MRRLVLSSLAVLVLMGVAPALANETGLAGIHAWMKIGKKTCMVDHFHSGTGSGPTKKLAEAAAARDWAGFTAFEYGTTWANPSIAVSRTMQCTQDGAAWSCQMDARACRPF